MLVVYSFYFVPLALCTYESSDEVIGYYCPGDKSRPFEVAPSECIRPNGIDEVNTESDIKMIHLKSEVKILGRMCKVTIKQLIHACTICSVGSTCLNLIEEKLLPSRISSSDCQKLIGERKYSKSFLLFNEMHDIIFKEIEFQEAKSQIIIGQLSHDGVCQGVDMRYESRNLFNAVVELNFRFEFESVPLTWMPMSGTMIFEGGSIKYDKGGYVLTNRGMVIFDSKEIECSKGYSQKAVSGHTKLVIGTKTIELLHINESAVFSIERGKVRYDTCLEAELTHVRELMYICDNCKPNVSIMSPEDQIRISEQTVRIDTISGYNLKMLEFEIDQINYDLCIFRNYLSISDPSFILSQYGTDYKGSRIETKHGVNYLTKCLKVNAKVQKSLGKCYRGLPVTYNDRPYFLNPSSNILEKRAKEIQCNDPSKPFYKAQTIKNVTTYFCNPPELSKCNIVPLEMKGSSKNNFRLSVGRLFQKRDYDLHINKILQSAKKNRHVVLETTPFKRQDNYIIPTKMSHISDENLPNFNFYDWPVQNIFNPLREFKSNLPTFSSLNTSIITIVIIVEWLGRCIINKCLSCTNIFLMLIFIFFPYLYLMHMYLLREKEERRYLRSRTN